MQNTPFGDCGACARYAGALVRRCAGIILFTIVTLIASLYLSADYKKIGAAVARFVPEKAQELAPRAQAGLSVLVKYLKAYLIIALITFAELSSDWLSCE